MFAVWEYTVQKKEGRTSKLKYLIICVRGWELTNMLRDYGITFLTTKTFFQKAEYFQPLLFVRFSADFSPFYM